MNLKGRKALIVGGSGFLGSHVADELESRGAEVTIYDAKKSAWLSPGQKFIQGHLLEKEKILQATQNQDFVYHFAAIADITESAEKRIETLEINVLGSAHLIEACLQNKVKNFVFASSVYVYSNKGSFYRITKQAVENLLEEYATSEGLDYRVLRYGSLYGPRAQSWNGLRKYVHSILQSGTVTLRGNGEAKREYIHVADAARLSVDVLDSSYKNQHLLLTGQQAITANELITMISEILDKKIDIKYESKQGDSHYVLTPYKFVPKHGHKLTSDRFVDFGQGLLEIIEELTNQKS